MTLNKNGRIYEQHTKAFEHVAAYAVLDRNGEHRARIALKYARSGLRTTAYVHWLGTPMVRAYASGGGYDKASAAVHSALQKMRDPDGVQHAAFIDAVKDEGRSWDRDLEDAGFQVLQAV